MYNKGDTSGTVATVVKWATTILRITRTMKITCHPFLSTSAWFSIKATDTYTHLGDLGQSVLANSIIYGKFTSDTLAGADWQSLITCRRTVSATFSEDHSHGAHPFFRFGSSFRQSGGCGGGISWWALVTSYTVLAIVYSSPWTEATWIGWLYYYYSWMQLATKFECSSFMRMKITNM